MQTADHAERKRHCYRIASSDFSHASDFAELLLKRRWFHPRFGGRTQVAVQQLALTTAFIVAYARPFSGNRGWGDKSRFPVADAHLEPEEDQLHARLISRRDGVFAHSDGTHHAYEPFERRGFKTAIVTVPGEHLEEADLRRALVMLKKFHVVAARLIQAH